MDYLDLQNRIRNNLRYSMAITGLSIGVIHLMVVLILNIEYLPSLSTVIGPGLFLTVFGMLYAATEIEKNVQQNKVIIDKYRHLENTEHFENMVVRLEKLCLTIQGIYGFIFCLMLTFLMNGKSFDLKNSNRDRMIFFSPIGFFLLFLYPGSLLYRKIRRYQMKIDSFNKV